MAYKGQPVPSSVHNIGYGKISDGKSVKVKVPENTKIEAGKFYLLNCFLGCAMQSVETGAGETAEVILNIEQAEYETDQIEQANFFPGQDLFWNDNNGVFTVGPSDDRPVGRVTVGNVGNGESNVIWFILGPQV